MLVIIKAQQMMDDYAKRSILGVPIDYIRAVVCRSFRLPESSIKARSRRVKIVRPRQVIMYFAKRMTNLSLSDIASLCGVETHATVIHGSKKIESLMRTDEKFKIFIEAIEKKLNALGE